MMTKMNESKDESKWKEQKPQKKTKHVCENKIHRSISNKANKDREAAGRRVKRLETMHPESEDLQLSFRREEE